MATVKPITSRANPQWQRLRRLAQTSAAYRKQGEVWIDGEHLCAAYALRGSAPLCAVIDEAAWQMPHLRALASRAETVLVVAAPMMAMLSTLESPPRIGFAIRWPGPGELLAGRLFIWDGLTAKAEEIAIEKNPACPACGGMHAAPEKSAGKKR